MKATIKKLVLGTPLERFARFVLNKPKIDFDNSGNYWDQRYTKGGNSGTGSYGRLSSFKADIINKFVSENAVASVIEFGCGDGNQLSLAEYRQYTGVDVSSRAIQVCSERFKEDNSKIFIESTNYNGQTAELSLSLDVIYHLVEDDVYRNYMSKLFSAATRFVIIYSSNTNDEKWNASHVKHRKFTDWIEQHATEFKLLKFIPNKYQFDVSDPNNTSLADFYIFEKQA